MARMVIAVVMTALTLVPQSAPGGDKKKKEEPKLVLSKVEDELLRMTNEAREKVKLPPLKTHVKLFEAAR
jgi:hypothetical protein